MGSIASVAENIKKGAFIFFLGSAFPVELGYPDSMSLAKILSARFISENVLCEDNFQDLSNIKDVFKSLEKRGIAKKDIYNTVRDVYRPDPSKLILNPYELFYQILKYYPENEDIFIVTANIDVTINSVFGNEATYIIYPSDFEALNRILEEGDILRKRRVWIIKINGDISSPAALDSFYENESFFEIKNQFFGILKKYLIKKEVLILGFNDINDSFLSDIYSNLREKNQQHRDFMILHRDYDTILNRFSRIRSLSYLYISSVLKDILYSIALVYMKTYFIDLEVDSIIKDLSTKNQNFLVYGSLFSGKSTTLKRLSKYLEKYDIYEITWENMNQDIKMFKGRFMSNNPTAIFIDYRAYQAFFGSPLPNEKDKLFNEVYEILHDFKNVFEHRTTALDSRNLISFYLALEKMQELNISKELIAALINDSRLKNGAYVPSIIYEDIKFLKKEDKIVSVQYYSKKLKEDATLPDPVPEAFNSYFSKVMLKLSLEIKKRTVTREFLEDSLKTGLFSDMIKNNFFDCSLPSLLTKSMHTLSAFIVLDRIKSNGKDWKYLDTLHSSWKMLSYAQKKLICYENIPDFDLIYHYLDYILEDDKEYVKFKELLSSITVPEPRSIFAPNKFSDENISFVLKGYEDKISEYRAEIEKIDNSINTLKYEISSIENILKSNIKDSNANVHSNSTIENNPIYEFGLGWLSKREPVISKEILQKLEYAVEKIKDRENIFVIGEKGIGKTTFLYLLYKKLQELKISANIVQSFQILDSETVYFIDNIDRIIDSLDALDSFSNSVFVSACRKSIWLQKNYMPHHGEIIEIAPNDFDFKTLKNMLVSILDSEKLLYSEEGLEEAVRRSERIPIYFDSLITFLKSRGDLLTLDLARIVPSEFYEIIANTITDLEKNEMMIWILYAIANTKKSRLHYFHIEAIKQLLGKMGIKGEFIEEYVSVSGDIFFLRHDTWKDIMLGEWRDMNINMQEPQILRNLRKTNIDLILKNAFRECINDSVNWRATIAIENIIIALENYGEFEEEVLKKALVHEKEDWRSLMIDTLANIDPELIENYLQDKSVEERFNLAKNLKNSPNASRIIYGSLVEHYKSMHKKDIAERANLAEALKNLGNSYSEKNELEEAIIKYTESIDIYRSLVVMYPAYESALAMVLNNLGIVLDLKGDLTNSIKAFDEALFLKQKLSMTDKVHYYDLAAILNNLGLAYSSKKAYQIAISVYNMTLDIYNNLKKENKMYEEDIAMVLDNLGLAQRDCGLVDESIKSFTDAITIYRALAKVDSRFEQDIAEVLKNMGSVFLRKRDFSMAIKELDEALNIYQKLNRIDSRFEPDIAETLSFLGETYAMLNEHEDAIRNFNSAINIYRALSKKDSRFEQYLSGTLKSMGKEYYLKGDFYLSIKLLRESLNLYRKLSIFDTKFEENIAETLFDLGAVYFKKKSYEDAAMCYNETTSIYRKIEKENSKFKVNLAKVLLLHANVLVLLKNSSSSACKYREAIALLKDLSALDKSFLDDLWIAIKNLAALYLEKKDFKSAKALYEESISVFNKLAEESDNFNIYLADYFYTLGKIYLDLHRIDESISSLKNALKIYEKSGLKSHENYLTTRRLLEFALLSKSS